MSSVGVLEYKSSPSRILEDNFQVLGLGLGLEGRVLCLEACVHHWMELNDYEIYGMK